MATVDAILNTLNDLAAAASQCCAFCGNPVTISHPPNSREHQKFADRQESHLQNFMKLWTRFVGAQLPLDLLSYLDDGEGGKAGVCQACWQVTAQFCALYHRIKMLEMVLEGKLAVLVGVMKKAKNPNKSRDLVVEKSCRRLARATPRVKLRPVDEPDISLTPYKDLFQEEEEEIRPTVIRINLVTQPPPADSPPSQPPVEDSDNDCGGDNVVTPPPPVPRKPGTSRRTKLKCDLCSKTFKRYATLRRHQVGTHNRCPVPDCPFEGTFDNLEELQLHQESAHGQCVDVVQCEYCPLAVSRARIRYHKVSHHHRCSAPDCEFQGQSRAELREHQMSEHKMEIDVFQCRQCNFVGIFSTSLLRHTRMVHSKSLTGSAKEFLKNKKRRTKQKTLLATCQFCGQRMQKQQYRNHLVKEHHKCGTEDCDYRGHGKRDLWQHQNRVHGQELDVFGCLDCDKLFVRKSHMMTHRIQSHTNRNKEATVEMEEMEEER